MSQGRTVALVFLLLAVVTLFFGVMLEESNFWTGLLGIMIGGIFIAFIFPRI